MSGTGKIRSVRATQSSSSAKPPAASESDLNIWSSAETADMGEWLAQCARVSLSKARRVASGKQVVF